MSTVWLERCSRRNTVEGEYEVDRSYVGWCEVASGSRGMTMEAARQ